MSDLKHLTLDQLKEREVTAVKAIEHFESQQGNLQGKINNESTRLHWIHHYMQLKETPVEMSIAEIQEALGYKILIKGEPQ